MTKFDISFFNNRVEKDYRKLPQDMRVHFIRIIELMEKFGTWNIGMPYVRHIVNTDLYEIRLKGKEGIARAIFISLVNNEIEILNVFIKKDEKTPKHEIDLALKRLNEVKNG